ncbi:MAG: hypothetical protein JW863_05720 [Chitinispirillaceae bacterium]|nr:hypothetical protein [Chitinispirillaceae bacterium]
MEEVLKEQALSLSGVTDDNGGAAVGKLLNADYMILSRLQFLGVLRFCSMRLVDCGSGEVLRAARVKL